MSDFDVAVVGTGVASLVAANRFHSAGKSVLLLNPDPDFFAEDSELPLDPFFPLPSGADSTQRLQAGLPENAMLALAPDFPGALESWVPGPGKTKAVGFHDPLAPHLRTRSRLWLTTRRSGDGDALERFYLEASDAGLNPQMIDGGTALARFPGFSSRQAQKVIGGGDEEGLRGVLIPRMADVDVSRYRNGLLEYIRERLGPTSVFSGVTQVERTAEGLRYHLGRTPRSDRIREAIYVFWTPRLSPWVLAQAKRAQVAPVLPRGVRLWEEWVLISREGLDPSAIGTFGEMAVWAEIEGDSGGDRLLDRLVVLRPGALVSAMNFPQSGPSSAWGSSWASSESFGDLMRLSGNLLKWDKFSIRSMRPRAIFEWETSSVAEKRWVIPALGAGPLMNIVGGCDGPLVDVVSATRAVCEVSE